LTATGARVLGVAAVAERCWPTAAAQAPAPAGGEAEERLKARAELQALPWEEAPAL